MYGWMNGVSFIFLFSGRVAQNIRWEGAIYDIYDAHAFEEKQPGEFRC